MVMRRITALLVAVLVLPAACGDDWGGGETGDTTDQVQTTPLTFGDGGEVWLRVDTGGGFVPAIVNQRQVPEVLLFDDGRLVRLTSVPGAVVPEFEVAPLEETEVAKLLDAAGVVIDGPDVGFPNVTDLPTTTIALSTDAQDGRLDVYALGYEDEQLAADEQAARAAVTTLLDDLAAAGEAEPYVPEEWLALTTATLEGADVTGSVSWPLDPDRAASVDSPAVCTRLTGVEVDQVLSTLAGSEFEFVAANGTVLEVALRPVLTGEETCNLSGYEDFVER
jgi:hypothetical protein